MKIKYKKLLLKLINVDMIIFNNRILYKVIMKNPRIEF